MTKQLTWTQMKAAVAAQATTDPQRAKLSERAWNSVEEGLRHLTSIGHNFEIAPRGTFAELVELREAEPGSRPLSIEDAKASVAGPPNLLTSKFEAIAGKGSLNA